MKHHLTNIGMTRPFAGLNNNCRVAKKEEQSHARLLSRKRTSTLFKCLGSVSRSVTQTQNTRRGERRGNNLKPAEVTFPLTHLGQFKHLEAEGGIQERLEMDKLIIIACLAALLAQSMPITSASESAGSLEELERAVLAAQASSSLRAEPSAAANEESYQRVYEAFTKLMQSTTNNSLGSVRRLVSRLNQLVGTPAGSGSGSGVSQEQLNAAKQQQMADEKTEQILNRLDKVNKTTDQNTLRDLNEDVSRLISSLNESYLRNIRRVIERVNKVVGPSAAAVGEPGSFHQYGDRLDDTNQKQPGFPGWDEFIVAVDRMQKSLANFVRSSTRLVTSG